MPDENPIEEEMEMLMDAAGFVCFNDDFQPWELFSCDYNSVVGEVIRMGSKFDEMNFEIEYLRDMYGIAMRDLSLAEESLSMMKSKVDAILRYLNDGGSDMQFAITELKSISSRKV